MIWAIDAVWMFVAILLSTAGFLAAGGVGATTRCAMVIAAITLLLAAQLYLTTAAEWNTWLVAGGVIAALAAAVAPARYLTSLVVLLALGCALAGLRGCPVGLAGLLHHVALIDLAGACLAVCCLGLQSTPGSSYSRPSSSGTDTPMDPPNAVAAGNGRVLPRRVARRAGVMLLLLCLILLWTLYRQQDLFGLPHLIGLCAGASEILAAVVAWRVIHEWLLSVHSIKQRGAGYRVGLLVAGLASAIALILVPVVISAARDLSASLPS